MPLEPDPLPPLALLDVVVLQADLPDALLCAGQLGTIVELLDAQTALVEFADARGQALAIAPVPVALLRRP